MMERYDSVLVPCPICFTLSEFKSKGGQCTMRKYKLKDCPVEVLEDVNRDAPNTCEKCEVLFYVQLEPRSKLWSER